MGFDVAIACILVCLSVRKFRGPLGWAIKEALRRNWSCTRLDCVFILALCPWRYARGLRGLGLPPGGTKRLDVSFAFAFGLPDAPSDLPLYADFGPSDLPL